MFCNRKKDKIKILQWEHNGFWLHYRRLEKGKFQWPDKEDERVAAISLRQLRWLLDGLTLYHPKAHPEVMARMVL